MNDSSDSPTSPVRKPSLDATHFLLPLVSSAVCAAVLYIALKLLGVPRDPAGLCIAFFGGLAMNHFASLFETTRIGWSRLLIAAGVGVCTALIIYVLHGWLFPPRAVIAYPTPQYSIKFKTPVAGWYENLSCQAGDRDLWVFVYNKEPKHYPYPATCGTGNVWESRNVDNEGVQFGEGEGKDRGVTFTLGLWRVKPKNDGAMKELDSALGSGHGLTKPPDSVEEIAPRVTITREK